MLLKNFSTVLEHEKGKKIVDSLIYKKMWSYIVINVAENFSKKYNIKSSSADEKKISSSGANCIPQSEASKIPRLYLAAFCLTLRVCTASLVQALSRTSFPCTRASFASKCTPLPRPSFHLSSSYALDSFFPSFSHSLTPPPSLFTSLLLSRVLNLATLSLVPISSPSLSLPHFYPHSPCPRPSCRVHLPSLWFSHWMLQPTLRYIYACVEASRAIAEERENRREERREKNVVILILLTLSHYDPFVTLAFVKRFNPSALLLSEVNFYCRENNSFDGLAQNMTESALEICSSLSALWEWIYIHVKFQEIDKFRFDKTVMFIKNVIFFYQYLYLSWDIDQVIK